MKLRKWKFVECAAFCTTVWCLSSIGLEPWVWYDLDQINFAASIRPFPRCGEDDFFEGCWLHLITSVVSPGLGLEYQGHPPKTRRSTTGGAGVPAMWTIAFQEIHQEPLSRKDIRRSLQIFGEIAKLATLQKNMWLFSGGSCQYRSSTIFLLQLLVFFFNMSPFFAWESFPNSEFRNFMGIKRKLPPTMPQEIRPPLLRCCFSRHGFLHKAWNHGLYFPWGWYS